MTLRVGITGGIGSGKTTVAKIFETLGIPVYYADDAAKYLMNHHQGLRQQLIQHFGEAVYKNDQLDSRFLAQSVFQNTEKLNLLNSIVHPLTIADAEQWMQRQTSPYALKEAALIFESGAQRQLDFVIGIAAPAVLRLARAMKRGKSTREEIVQRMNQQLDEVIKMKLCDFVINNNEQLPVLPQVMEIHQQLLALAGAR